MQNNFITKISPSVRIIVLMLLILSLLFAKSIYLILFITTLILVLVAITDKKVNLYVKALKKVSLLLLIFLILYIIMFRQYDIFLIILLLYKCLLIVVLFKVFLFNIDLKSMHEGLYGVFLPLKKLKMNVEIFSLDVILSIYFISFLIESKYKIKYVQKIRGKRMFNIKNYILPRLLYSINKLDRLQENLKIKLYKLNYKKADLKSKFIFILFFVLFIICIFKEVVL